MQFKNPVEPKIGYIYEGYDGHCYVIDSFTVSPDFVRQINLSMVSNPKKTLTVTDEAFRSEIDFERFPRLQGKKLYNYTFIGKK